MITTRNTISPLSIAIAGLLISFGAFLMLAAMPGCVSAPGAGQVTSQQQTVANAVEDALAVGLVPVFTNNPSYVGAANSIAAALGAFSGSTITPADVDAFLARTPLKPADARVVAGVVNGAWAIYVKRYSQQVNASVRPDVQLFLGAVSNGILAAAAAVPK